MYGEVDSIKLGKTLSPNWRHNLSQRKEYLLKKYPWHRGRYHSSVKVLGRYIECPLQVCQISKSSEITHFLSLVRNVIFFFLIFFFLLLFFSFFYYFIFLYFSSFFSFFHFFFFFYFFLFSFLVFSILFYFFLFHFFIFQFFIIFFYFSLTSTFQLLDKPWSQVSSLLPPGSCLQFYRA